MQLSRLDVALCLEVPVASRQAVVMMQLSRRDVAICVGVPVAGTSAGSMTFGISMQWTRDEC